MPSSREQMVRYMVYAANVAKVTESGVTKTWSRETKIPDDIHHIAESFSGVVSGYLMQKIEETKQKIPTTNIPRVKQGYEKRKNN